MLRVSKYAGNTSFSHIYIVVPIDGDVNNVKTKGSYYTIDCVPDKFNYEAPNVIDTIDIKRTVNGSVNGLGILRETIVTPISELKPFPEDSNSAIIPETATIQPAAINPAETISKKENLLWLYATIGTLGGVTICAALWADKKSKITKTQSYGS